MVWKSRALVKSKMFVWTKNLWNTSSPHQQTSPAPIHKPPKHITHSHTTLNSCFTRLYKHMCTARLLCLQPVHLFTHLSELHQHFHFLISITWHVYFIAIVSKFSFIEKSLAAIYSTIYKARHQDRIYPRWAEILCEFLFCSQKSWLWCSLLFWFCL